MSPREPELYKDKIEVSLDGRQIFYLFFGGATLVGLVFVLGVMVGRRVESRSHVDQIGRSDGARAASDPLAALDALEGKKLTFQAALMKPERQRDDVEHQIDLIEQARVDKPADKTPPKADKPAEKPAEKPIDKPIEKPIDKPIEKPDAKKKKDDKPKASEPVTKPEQAMLTPKKPTNPKKIDDARSVNADVVTADDDKKSDDKKAEPKDKGKFTLQLSSFQDKREAETFLSSVKAAGYQAYVTEAEVNGKGYYRVRLGNYRSLEAANDAKVDVEKALKKTASVMRL